MIQEDPFQGPVAGAVLLASMRERGVPMDFPAGVVLFSAGDEGSSFFLLEEGTIRLDFPGAKDSIFLKAGAIFGELGLIFPDHHRTATAVAETKVRLIRFEADILGALIQDLPEETLDFFRSVASYLLRSEQGLVSRLTRRTRELEVTLDYLRRTREELDAAQIDLMTDPLTGLYNRRCFTHNLEQMTQRSGGALLLLDLDDFKAVNDRFGHLTGDQILQHVAKILQATVRSTDLPCRIGGDELAVILPGSDRSEAEALAQRILQALRSSPSVCGGVDIPVTCSIGGAVFAPAFDARQAIRRADDALYRAKRSGRDTLRWTSADA